MENLFPKRLREVRESTKLSQTDFAEKIGISRASLSYYENGTRTPDVYLLRTVHEATGVSIYYLLGITDTKNDEFQQAYTNLGLNEKALDTLRSLTIMSKDHKDTQYAQIIMQGINKLLTSDDGFEILKLLVKYLSADFSGVYMASTPDDGKPMIDHKANLLTDPSFAVRIGHDEAVLFDMNHHTFEKAYLLDLIEKLKKWKEAIDLGKETTE